MKVVGLACALALGVNSINVREEQHEGTYSLANWQQVCVALISFNKNFRVLNKC